MSNRPSVLIVDDEPEIGNLLKLFLEGDFEVATFTDPRVACDEIKKTHYDLVVSDIKMPFLTGLDVVKHVKSVRPSTHVVLITGHAQTEKDKAEATALGAAGVLFKPFGDPLKVVDYLSGVIGGVSAVPAANGTVAVTAVSPASSQPAAQAAPHSKPKSGKPSILVIDDEGDLTDVLSMLLEDEFDVVVFNNPVTAVQNYRQGEFKAVMTDLNMPQMSGKDVIAKIRSLSPEIPIIVMTGHGETEPEVVEALRVGGSGVLAKPFPDPTVILDKLKEMMK
jgi:DNA-binding NtrC family response regulator